MQGVINILKRQLVVACTCDPFVMFSEFKRDTRVLRKKYQGLMRRERRGVYVDTNVYTYAQGNLNGS